MTTVSDHLTSACTLAADETAAGPMTTTMTCWMILVAGDAAEKTCRSHPCAKMTMTRFELDSV